MNINPNRPVFVASRYFPDREDQLPKQKKIALTAERSGIVHAIDTYDREASPIDPDGRTNLKCDVTDNTILQYIFQQANVLGVQHKALEPQDSQNSNYVAQKEARAQDVQNWQENVELCDK